MPTNPNASQGKTSSEWIREALEGFNDQTNDRDMLIARTIVARQLAQNSKKGLNDTKITEEQLNKHAEGLLQSVSFQVFLDHYQTRYETADIKKLDGSRIENKLKDWVRSQPEDEYDELPRAIFGRYKFGSKEEYTAHQQSLAKDKTAAEIIEGIQNKVNYNEGRYSEKDLATILAARQLANAKRGSRKNLDNTRISLDDLDRQINKLIVDPVFKEYTSERRKQFENKLYQDRKAELMDTTGFENYMANKKLTDPEEAWKAYVKQHGDPVKVRSSETERFFPVNKLTRGHSGELEDDFEAYLKTREDLKELDSPIYDRYKKKFGIVTEEKKEPEKKPEPAPKYAGYKDYFTKNAGGRPADLKQAAKMAAAHALAVKHPNSPYSAQELDKKTADMLNDPTFRLVMRDKATMNAMIAGDAGIVAEKTAEAVKDFAGVALQHDEDGEEMPFSTTRGFTLTYNRLDPAIPEKDLEKTERALIPDICKKQKEEFEKFVDEKSKKDAMYLLKKEYKEKMHTLKSFDDDLKEDLEMQFRLEKLKADVRKRLIDGENEKYRNEVDLSAHRNAVFSVAKKHGKTFIDIEDDPAYAADIEKAIPGERNKILMDHRKLGIGPGTNEGRAHMQAREKAIDMAHKKQLGNRGPKFRNMIASVNKLMHNTGDASEKDLIGAVNSILEYQDGKEKGFFSSSKNQRFNDSMTLLAEITMGTPAEKYYRAQLDKVNAARGLRPGTPGYLKPEDFLHKDTEVVDTAEKELQEEQADLDLYNKIKNFSFRKNDGQDNEQDENEIEPGNDMEENKEAENGQELSI